MSIDAELGCYDNAEKLLSIPNSLVTALGTVMLPRVSNSIAKGELKSVNEMIQKSMLFVVFATSALVFGICAVAKEFVPFQIPISEPQIPPEVILTITSSSFLIVGFGTSTISTLNGSITLIAFMILSTFASKTKHF